MMHAIFHNEKINDAYCISSKEFSLSQLHNSNSSTLSKNKLHYYIINHIPQNHLTQR